MHTARSGNNLLIRQPFNDVLSGEFHPPSDPEGRTHRLDRLAYRTFIKGTMLERNFLQTGRKDRYEYTPSWAEDTRVMASGDIMFNTNIHTLSGLAIVASSGSQLTLDHSIRQGAMVVAINGEPPLEIGLSENIDAIRGHITGLAQALFDTVER